MKLLVIAIFAAAGFGITRYWPRLTRQDFLPPGLAGRVTSEIAPAVEDTALLEFARSLANADAASLGALYVSLPARFAPGRLEMAQRLVLLRWAEVAPREALTWLKANAPGDLPLFLVAWSESDAGAAWQAVSADCPEARGRVLMGIYERLKFAPPEIVIATIHTLPDEALVESNLISAYDTESLYAAAFHKLATANPADALERALSLTGIRRASSLAGVAVAHAEKNPADALEWARSLTEKADRNAALGPVIVDLSRRDPEAAGALLKESEQPFEFSSRRYGPGAIILRQFSKDNPALAYEWAERYASPGDLSDAVGMAITQAAAHAHPRELPAIIAAITNNQVQQQAIRALDGYASPSALPELAEGAAALQQGEVRDELLRRIFRAWADESADDALARARALPAGPLRDAALAGTTEKLIWRQPDSPGILEIINSLPDTLRPQIYEKWLAAPFAQSSPDKAAALLEEIKDPAIHASMATEIARNWMQIDTPAALAFVETLSGSERTSALGRLFDGWAAADPPAVTGWIAAQPPGEDRDAAIGAFIVQGNRHGEVEAAFRWSLEISDSPRRKSLISVSAGNLVRQDRELAVRLTSEANFTDAERRMVDALLTTNPPSAK